MPDAKIDSFYDFINLYFCTQMQNNIANKYFTLHNFSVFAISCIILGSFSETIRAIPGIAMAFLLVVGLLRRDVLKRLQKCFSSPYFWSISGMCIIYFFFCVIHWSTVSIVSVISIKLPHLILPVALFMYPAIKPKAQLMIYYVFLCALFTTALGATINYVINFDAINQQILQSKPLPVVINHVRYSLIITFGIFCSYFLYKKKLSIWNHKIEKRILLFLVLFFFFFLHIASVRSGLAAFYLVLIIYVFYYFIFQSRKWKYGISSLLVIIIVPIIAYFIAPSFKNKVENTFIDLAKVEQEEKANTYSMVGRIFSYKVGWEVFTESPVMGVGPQNMNRITKKQYNARFPSITKILLPHNQFLYWAVSMGLIGMLFCCVLFYYPLFYQNNYSRMPILLIHYLIVSVSFLVESTLETQYGANFTLLFIILPLFFYGKISSTD